MDPLSGELCKVVSVFDDISRHKAKGDTPQVGDEVLLTGRREGLLIWAVEVNDRYAALFDDRQLKVMPSAEGW